MDAASPISRIKRPIVLGGVLAALALGTVPAAPAAAGEVHFDSDSPAGKEYALPLPQARNEALGGEGITGGSPAQAPLFGVGVSSPNKEGGGAGGGGHNKDKGGSGDRDDTEGGATAANGDAGGPGASSAPQQAGSDSSYGLGTGIGLVAAVLVAAVLLGILLRALTHTGGRRLSAE